MRASSDILAVGPPDTQYLLSSYQIYGTSRSDPLVNTYASVLVVLSEHIDMYAFHFVTIIPFFSGAHRFLFLQHHTTDILGPSCS